MTTHLVLTDTREFLRLRPNPIELVNRSRSAAEPSLAVSITRAASKQTYYTIRLLADRDRLEDAYSAYAYFRWVDDCIDETLANEWARSAFLNRQRTLIEWGYDAAGGRDLTGEERMIVALMRGDPATSSGLLAYIQHMMAVMTFDVSRKDRLITEQELAAYTRDLAIAVTEALHYFIGHDDAAPQCDDRYLAVTAAHITHMLRDAFEDAAAGYYNIPCEFLEAHQINPWDITCDAYRTWVKSRVQLARAYFQEAESYLAQVKSRRCRLAGYAYTARFQWILDVIEQEDYLLRPAYPERKGLKAGLKMGMSAIRDCLKHELRSRHALGKH